MEPADALSRGAQIAVAFAGLTGVVLMRRGATIHTWPKADKFRLKLLLSTTLLPLVLCLVGLLLLGVNIQEAVVWRVCSAVAALVLLGGCALFSRSFLGMNKRELDRVEASRPTFWIFTSLGVIQGLFLVYNTALLAAFWPFFMFIVSALLVALLQFIRFILARSAPVRRRKT
jgi:small-conductance mechanosensitive channel